MPQNFDDQLGDPFEGHDPFGIKRLRRSMGVPESPDYGGHSTGPARVNTPEEESSLLGTLGEKTLGFASTAGNVLDTLGSTVRGGLDVLTGGDPAERAAGIIDPSKRITGREQLEKWGAVGPNTDQGWMPDLGDIAGFGYEIATDPLTYATLGGSAVGKLGQIFKNAGMMKSAQKVGKAAGLGKAGTRVGLTGDDVLRGLTKEAAAEAMPKLQRAAKGMGVNLDDVLGDKLGSSFGVHVPLTDIRYAPKFAQGPLAQKIAGWTDKAGDWMRYGNPVGRRASAMFDSSKMNALSHSGQENFAEPLFDTQTQLRANAKAMESELVSALSQEHPQLLNRGIDNQIELSRMLEGVQGATQPGPRTAAAIDHARQFNNQDIFEKGAEFGLKSDELYDPTRQYWPGKMADIEGAHAGTGRSGPQGTSHASMKPRLDALRGIGGGQGTVIEMTAKDADLKKLIDLHQELTRGASSGGTAPDLQALAAQLDQAGVSHDKIAALLKQKYGHLLPDAWESFNQETKQFDKVTGRTGQIAKHLTEWSPELREAGVYRDPIDAWKSYMTGRGDAVLAGENTLRGLANPEFMQQAWKDTGKGGRSVRAPDLFRELNMDPVVAAEKLAQLTGRSVDDVSQMLVPETLRRDLTRAADSFQGPEAAKGLLGLYDKVLNLSKAGFTVAHPAFHARNRPSGLVQNVLTGLQSANPLKYLKSRGDTAAITKGGDIADALNIPGVREALTARNLPHDPREATNILREWSHSTGLSGNDMQMNASDLMLKGEAKPHGSEMPGGPYGQMPFEWGDALKTYVGGDSKAGAQRFNPVNVEKFGPIQGGAKIGSHVEDMNRIQPFVEQLRKGVDKDEAARRIQSAQVDYSGRNYTAFERDWLARGFPFYKFQKGMLSHTGKALAERPGGPLSMAIKAQGAAAGDQQAPVPEFVSQSSNIPLGKLDDGSLRYLTGLGLMHEDPLNLAFSGAHRGAPKGTALELMSRMSPLPKGLLEWANDKSYYQHGMDEARPLHDADPLMGRLLANVGKMTGLRDEDNTKPVDTSPMLESLLANSPFARYLSTARTATDTRKHGSPANLAAMAANLGTGVRVMDVSPAAQAGHLRELVQKEESDLGGRKFETVYFTKEQKASMTPEKLKRVEALEALSRSEDKKRKDRSKKSKAEKAMKKFAELGTLN